MENVVELVRPYELQVGGRYVRIEVLDEPKMLELSPVTLAAYDSCPAFVIVLKDSGSKVRCPRDEIFLSP